MTISECLKTWLTQYDRLDFSMLLTDFIDAPDGAVSIFSTPQSVERPFIDGSKQVTEYYNFFVRASNQLEEQRVENQEIVEDFCNWIEEMDMAEDYPVMPEGMSCDEISAVNGAILSQENDNAIYQVTISITYVKERRLCQR